MLTFRVLWWHYLHWFDLRYEDAKMKNITDSTRLLLANNNHHLNWIAGFEVVSGQVGRTLLLALSCCLFVFYQWGDVSFFVTSWMNCTRWGMPSVYVFMDFLSCVVLLLWTLHSLLWAKFWFGFLIMVWFFISLVVVANCQSSFFRWSCRICTG